MCAALVLLSLCLTSPETYGVVGLRSHSRVEAFCPPELSVHLKHILVRFSYVEAQQSCSKFAATSSYQVQRLCLEQDASLVK